MSNYPARHHMDPTSTKARAKRDQQNGAMAVVVLAQAEQTPEVRWLYRELATSGALLGTLPVDPVQASYLVSREETLIGVVA